MKQNVQYIPFFYIQSVAPTVLYLHANFPYCHRIPCCGCVKQPTMCTGWWKYLGDWSPVIKKCHLFLQGCVTMHTQLYSWWKFWKLNIWQTHRKHIPVAFCCLTVVSDPGFCAPQCAFY